MLRTACGAPTCANEMLPLLLAGPYPVPLLPGAKRRHAMPEAVGPAVMAAATAVMAAVVAAMVAALACHMSCSRRMMPVRA